MSNYMAVVLWILWAGTAGDTVAGKGYYFPAGCIYDSCRPMVLSTGDRRSRLTVLQIPWPIRFATNSQ